MTPRTCPRHEVPLSECCAMDPGDLSVEFVCEACIEEDMYFSALMEMGEEDVYRPEVDFASAQGRVPGNTSFELGGGR